MEDGFFELKTVQDMYDKLCWEYENLKENPLDVRVAFNFFVTAEHIPDWMGKKGMKNQPLLKICSHLANGAKHFRVSEKHSAVKSARKNCYVEKGYVEEGCFYEPLIVDLDQTLADKANLENPIEILQLAKEVIEYWKNMIDDSD